MRFDRICLDAEIPTRHGYTTKWEAEFEGAVCTLGANHYRKCITPLGKSDLQTVLDVF